VAVTIEAAEINRLLAAALSGRSPLGQAGVPSGPALFRDLFKEALRDADSSVGLMATGSGPGASAPADDALLALARREIALRLMEAMRAAPAPAMPGTVAPEQPEQPVAATAADAAGPGPAAARSPAPARTPSAPEGSLPGLPTREVEIIAREASRAGVDPALLAALRRAENGGPGREFGVLSVPAPSLDDQARVAANSIRNAAARFERQGGLAVDPATGRYTDEFLRFFSARYAPVGADNDPGGLNRHHARNLQRLYARFRADEAGTAQT
jgi:hypothetical protein